MTKGDEAHRLLYLSTLGSRVINKKKKKKTKGDQGWPMTVPLWTPRAKVRLFKSRSTRCVGGRLQLQALKVWPP